MGESCGALTELVHRIVSRRVVVGFAFYDVMSLLLYAGALSTMMCVGMYVVVLDRIELFSHVRELSLSILGSISVLPST